MYFLNTLLLSFLVAKMKYLYQVLSLPRTTLLNLLKSTGTCFNLSTSILSTSVFVQAKFGFSAKLEVLIPVASVKSAFVA